MLGEQPDTTHLVLFDEFNLTRPEFYLSRFFHALDAPGGQQPRVLPFRKALGIGTMNIDDTSRAPSPKVLDRCFLVEVSQVAFDRHRRSRADARISELPRLPGLPSRPNSAGSIEGQLEKLLAGLSRVVREHDLREDLLPSRRVLDDIRATVALHADLGPSARTILPAAELLDRLVSSRVLVKLSGAIEQVNPALEFLERFVDDEASAGFVRVKRRVALARRQSRLGFVSPWH